jgi:hypothetical protein
MLDVLRNDEKASFFFIGAEDEKDETRVMATRRFQSLQALCFFYCQ